MVVEVTALPAVRMGVRLMAAPMGLDLATAALVATVAATVPAVSRAATMLVVVAGNGTVKRAVTPSPIGQCRGGCRGVGDSPPAVTTVATKETL